MIRLLKKLLNVGPIKFLKPILRKMYIPILQSLQKQKMRLYHDVYGTIYYPPYNTSVEINNIPMPHIYNREGRRMEQFFIRDAHGAHVPYGSCSKYFLWDRYNIGLDTHFYTHESMLATMGNPSQRYGMFCESETIVPESYKIFDKHHGLEKDFDLIFTYSDELLSRLSNSRFFPAVAQPWYGTKLYGGELSPCSYLSKDKNISIVSSSKISCNLHKLRFAIACDAKTKGLADTYGTFDGGEYVKNLSDVYSRYRYSMTIENDIKPFYFSERLTNCFAAMTIPIYIGATQIGNFFNMDGIIQIKPEDYVNIETILAKCSENDYKQRIPAIIDNYNRVQKYINIEDWLYEEYLMTETSQYISVSL